MTTIDPTRPRDPGLNGWFALAALVLTIVLNLAHLGVLAGLAVILTVMWATIWAVRVYRVTQWARSRSAAE